MNSGKKILLFVLLACPFFTFSQLKKGIEYSRFFDSYYWRGPLSITGGFGLGAYSGDLCSGFACSQFKPNYSLGVSYKVWPRVIFGSELSYFSLAAKDAFPSRGFDFKSTNLSLGIYGQFLLREDIVKRHGDLFKSYKWIKPYVSLGATGMRYSVVVKDTSETTFPKYAVTIPIGFGLLIDYTHRVKFALEGNYHISFTDYLDGISAFANPSKNDAFGTIKVKIIYAPTAKRMKAKKLKLTDDEKARIESYTNEQGYNEQGEVEDKPKVEDPDKNNPYYEDSEKTKTDESVDPNNNWDAPSDEAPTEDAPIDETAPKSNDSGSDW